MTVQTDYANLLTKTNAVLNRNANLNKSPTSISVLTKALATGTDTFADMGDTTKYTNIEFAGGYLDFNRDPLAGDADSAPRQTKMHAINSWLHPTANQHNLSPQNTYNLFFGSSDANQYHLHAVEHQAKRALDVLRLNHTGAGLFNELYTNNVQVKTVGGDIVLNDNVTNYHHVSRSPFAHEGNNYIDEGNWKIFTAFALEYQTDVTYYNAAQLEAHFRLPTTISDQNLARGIAKKPDNTERDADEMGAYLSDGMDQLQIADPTYLTRLVNGITRPSIEAVFDVESVVANLAAADFLAILTAMLPADLANLYVHLGGSAADLDKSANAIVANFSQSDIADYTFNGFQAELNTAVQTLGLAQLRTYLLNGDPDELREALGDIMGNYHYGLGTYGPRVAGLQQLPSALLGESSIDYVQAANAAATELADMACKTFKSEGAVYTPVATPVWTPFKNLNVAKEITYGPCNLTNIANYPNHPAPNVAFKVNQTKQFNV
ncbi:MAG: hypothetical protein K0S11_72 [Gammaproteobacteria bacterium]|jgi:hypothetical protein|nr:hypothetical protein [Gammaproteobacteria bacterium]